MILEHLYPISLEHPYHWAVFFGLPVNTMKLLDARIDQLNSYIFGLRESCGLSDIAQPDVDAFFEWLRDVRLEFPTEGWATKYFNDCGGDHMQAIVKFWGLLREYLVAEKPAWFVRLNAKPLPSQIRNGAGVPHSPDIRHPEHIGIGS